MSIEFELKYRATPAQLAAIEGAFSGEVRVLNMETTYYDTPGGDFSARKITLRRRMENGTPVCTLKTPAVMKPEIAPKALPSVATPVYPRACNDTDMVAARGEYECCCDSIEAALPELCKLAGLPELLILAEAGLCSVCGARFTRMAKLLTFPDFTAELALDRGVLTGGDKEIPLCEAEVELKSGSPEAMCAFAGELAEKYGLVPESRSKFRRALALAKGED